MVERKTVIEDEYKDSKRLLGYYNIIVPVMFGLATAAILIGIVLELIHFAPVKSISDARLVVFGPLVLACILLGLRFWLSRNTRMLENELE